MKKEKTIVDYIENRMKDFEWLTTRMSQLKNDVPSAVLTNCIYKFSKQEDFSLFLSAFVEYMTYYHIKEMDEESKARLLKVYLRLKEKYKKEIKEGDDHWYSSQENLVKAQELLKNGSSPFYEDDQYIVFSKFSKNPRVSLKKSTDSFKKSVVYLAIGKHNGNRTAAAKWLGISREALRQCLMR